MCSKHGQVENATWGWTVTQSTGTHVRPSKGKSTEAGGQSSRPQWGADRPARPQLCAAHCVSESPRSELRQHLRTCTASSSERESESPGEKRRSAKGQLGTYRGKRGWSVRGEERGFAAWPTGGAWSTAGGRRDTRAKKVIVIEYKSHQVKNGSNRTLHREVQRGHADTWQTLQRDARTWPGWSQWAWLPAAENLNVWCLSLSSEEGRAQWSLGL